VRTELASESLVQLWDVPKVGYRSTVCPSGKVGAHTSAKKG